MINHYLEQRKQVLLAVLEETNIIDKGVGLRKLYAEKYVQLFGQDAMTRTFNIDIKTLWRSACALANEGLAYVRAGDVLLLNGNRAKKEILINKSLNPDGPEISSYFEHMTERRVLQPIVLKLEPIAKTDLVVESLDDRLKRMQQSLEEAQANGNLVDAKRLETDIKAIKKSAAKSNGTIVPYSSRGFQGNWLTLSMQFGYINSRVIRVKMFHEYLLDLLLSGDAAADGVDSDTRTIPTTVMIMNMTVGLFCKILGVFAPTTEFADFMQDEKNDHLKLGDLPDHIRGCIFQARNRFRLRLRLMLECLMLLGVVENVEPKVLNIKGVGDDKSPDAPSHLGYKYKLATETSILNYRLPGYPPVRTHSLMDQESLLAYWNDLEYVYTKSDLDENEIETANPQVPENEGGAWIKSLYYAKNWSLNVIFTRQQRETMNKYIDRDQRATPLKNLLQCKTIAAEIGANLSGVHLYYTKMEEAMDPQLRHIKLKKERKPRSARRSRYHLTTNNDHLISSPFKFKRNQPQTAMTKLASQQQVGDERSDDDSNVPTLTQGKNTRIDWLLYPH